KLQTVQRTGANRFSQTQTGRQRLLAPVADLGGIVNAWILSGIYVHDGKILRVIEEPDHSRSTMQVELAVLEQGERLEPRLLVFEDVYGYQVVERTGIAIQLIVNCSLSCYSTDITSLRWRFLGSGRWFQLNNPASAPAAQ